MAHFQSLLLKNGGSDRNMCSLNSPIQLLKHIPEFVETIHSLESKSAIFSVFSSILLNCGTDFPVSASLLRQLLANAVAKPLDSGAQHDTVELLSYLLDI